MMLLRKCKKIQEWDRSLYSILHLFFFMALLTTIYFAAIDLNLLSLKNTSCSRSAKVCMAKINIWQKEIGESVKRIETN